MNNIEIFKEKSLQSCKRYAELKKEMKKFEQEEKELKEKIQNFFNEHGIDKFDNEFIKISKINKKATSTIDLKKLEIADKDLYDTLFAKYPKMTKASSYVKIEVK